MKKFIKIYLIFLLSIFLNSQLIISQETTNKISFIKIDENKGYLIDSLENLNCKCLPVTVKSFLYAALLQLPDSSIILRTKNNNIPGFIDIKLDEIAIKNLHNKKLNADAKKLIIGTSTEFVILKSMVSDTTEYQLIDYAELKIPSYLRKKQLEYLNLGIGGGNLGSGPIYKIEVGILFKKNIFSISSKMCASETIPLFNFDATNNEIAVLYGSYFNSKNAIITFSAGIAYYTIYKGGFVSPRKPGPQSLSFVVRTFNTIGLPMQIGFSTFPQSVLGFSFDIFADINKQQSFVGCVLGFRLGRLKSKFY